jgi:hypothetical protein
MASLIETRLTPAGLISARIIRRATDEGAADEGYPHWP